jgi:GxxExxY protein
MAEPTKLIHEGLSHQIIGAAMAVLNELGPSLPEKLYERALIIELKDHGIAVATQRGFPVCYKGKLIGTVIPDLLIEDKVIVDTKVVECFHDVHIAQLIGYLAKTKLDLGLLLNFKYPQLKWKRLVRDTSR